MASCCMSHKLCCRSCFILPTLLLVIWAIWQYLTVASPAMGHWGTFPPRLVTVSFLVHLGVTLRGEPTIQVLCSLRDQLMQMSTTYSSFDQYCISHKTISHRAAAAPALKPAVSAPWHNFHLCPSSQQILATPLVVPYISDYMTV